MTKREEILGRGVFEVFPDNPNDPKATGVRNLRASLERVLHNKVPDPDTMAVQKYDIRRPQSEGGEFEERYWSPVNSPILDSDNEVSYIVHRVEDVTEFVRAEEQEAHQKKVAEELRARAAQIESDLFLRAKEVQETNQRLAAANRELAQSESRFRSLFEFSPDAIIVTDEKGRIAEVNGQVSQFFGYERSELTGQPVEILIPERFRKAHPAHRAHYSAEPHTRPMGAGLELYGRRKDGTEFPADVMLSPVDTGSGKVVLAVVRDLSEKVRAEEELQRKDRERRGNQLSFSGDASPRSVSPQATVLSDEGSVAPRGRRSKTVYATWGLQANDFSWS